MQDITPLVNEILNDPASMGYLSVESDDVAWNIFNLLRAPATSRLAAIGLSETEMAIEDVRQALSIIGGP